MYAYNSKVTGVVKMKTDPIVPKGLGNPKFYVQPDLRPDKRQKRAMLNALSHHHFLILLCLVPGKSKSGHPILDFLA